MMEVAELARWEVMTAVGERGGSERIVEVGEDNDGSSVEVVDSTLVGMEIGARTVLPIRNGGVVKKEANKRPMTLKELMKATYQKKNTKEWSGSEIEYAMKHYPELYADFCKSHPEGVSKKDAQKLWDETFGGPHKGRMFVQGSLYSSLPDFRNPAAQEAPSLSPETNPSRVPEVEDMIRKEYAEIAKLREEMLEAKNQYEAEKAKIQAESAQICAEQRQRLMDMQQPHYMHNPSATINNSYTSLLNSTSAGFLHHPMISTPGFGTPYVSQVGGMPMYSSSPSFDPLLHRTSTTSGVRDGGYPGGV